MPWEGRATQQQQAQGIPVIPVPLYQPWKPPPMSCMMMMMMTMTMSYHAQTQASGSGSIVGSGSGSGSWTWILKPSPASQHALPALPTLMAVLAERRRQKGAESRQQGRRTAVLDHLHRSKAVMDGGHGGACDVRLGGTWVAGWAPQWSAVSTSYSTEYLHHAVHHAIHNVYHVVHYAVRQVRYTGASHP